MRSRAEVWIYRKLRPLMAEREESRLPHVGAPELPELGGKPRGLSRYRRLAAGAVLVAAAATGGTVIGYGWGHEAGEDGTVAGVPVASDPLQSTAEDLCQLRAEVAAAELVHEEGGAAEAEECRAEQQVEAARLVSETEEQRRGH